MKTLLFVLTNGQLNNDNNNSWQQSDCDSMGLFALDFSKGNTPHRYSD